MRFMRRGAARAKLQGDAAGPGAERQEATRAVPGAMLSAAEEIDRFVAAAERMVQAVEGGFSKLPTGSSATSDRLVSELAATLLDRTQELQRDAARIARVLERSGARLAGSAPRERPAGAADGRGLPVEVTEGIRLLVTHMSVGGSSREEIALRLERDFDVADPRGVIDEVLSRG